MILQESNLRDYQRAITEFILTHRRCNIFAGMGTGKTASALTAIRAIRLVDDDPVLVLAPPRVAVGTWPSEGQKWAHLRKVFILPITGTPARRAFGLKAPADVYTINYEQLPWLVDHYGDAWPFAHVIADESTRLKNFRLGGQGGKRAGVLFKIAHKKVRTWVNLTGTPAPNGLMDLWGQMWFIDEGKRLGKTITAYKQRWFRPAWSGFGVEPVKGAQEEIQSLIEDVSLTIDGSKYVDLLPLVENTIVVPLPAPVRVMYKDMERKLFAEIAPEIRVHAVNAAAKTMKLLQLANGAVYPTADTSVYQAVHDAKLEALDSVIAEAGGMPVLVAYHFKSDLARLKARYKQGRELTRDPKVLGEWNKGHIPLLFAHPASAGHGLSLQDGSNVLAFFSLNWNLEEHMQIIERIGPMRQAQSGYKRSVYVHRLVAENTIDELVLQRLTTKRTVQEILLAAMEKGI